MQSYERELLTATCNGDGNGLIDTNLGESFHFWQHLANAGMIEGHYTGAGDILGGTDSEPGKNVPPGPIAGTGFSVRYMPDRLNMTGYFDGHYGNVIMFGKIQLDGFSDSSVLTPLEAFSVDQKLDDGMPGTGFVRYYNTDWAPSCVTSNNATTATYNTTYQDIACGLLFPEAF